ncbi:MAG: phytanoyl-CoA dioxygenase, partial [Roseobacter sp.]
MNTMQKTQRGYYAADACDLSDFAALVLRDVNPRDVPQACETPQNVPVYDMQALSGQLTEVDRRRGLMAEWARILQSGAGVFVLRHACEDTSAIDAATAIFNDIIAREKAGKGTRADHFAAAGSNDRIWNSLQKLCEADPETFIRYHANPAIDAAC